jgi:hypothetical protein
MTYTTRWDEDMVLAYFWEAAREWDVDRIALLKQIADVRLERPSDWDRRAIRAQLDMLRDQWRGNQPKSPIFQVDMEACFACLNKERRLYWHHVVTVQHGGSSQPRNIVPLCHVHHQAVHPFLPDSNSVENRYGWTQVGHMATRAMARLMAHWEHEQEARR